MNMSWMLWLMDLALERSPYSERGFLVGMLVFWAAALFVVVRTVGWGFARKGAGGEPLDANVDQSRMGERIKEVAQFAAGALIMLALAGLFRTSIPSPELPSGWMTIRAPYITPALAIEGDSVWAGGVKGITLLDRVTGKVLETPRGAAKFTGVTDLLFDGEVLWVAHYRGLSRRDAAGEWTTFDAGEGMLPGPASALYRDRLGRLWVGTKVGVARFDGDRWETFTPDDGLLAPDVDVIFEDRDGDMWFGSSSPRGGGLSRWDGVQWTTYTVDDGLLHPAITDIIQDRSGVLWVGQGFGREGGVSRLVEGAWLSLLKEDGLAGEKVRSLHEDEAGRLWFGSEYDGLAIHEAGRWHIVTPREGLAGWEVLEIVRDHQGIYWLGTDRGVNRIDHPELLIEASAAAGG